MKFSAQDVRASLVVFLVALPLCLGIALASGAPLSAGIIAGIIGGVVVGIIGGSEISVSGPAAGLTVIVASAIIELGSYSSFSTAIALAGVLQLVMGFLKAGELGNFFPASVIKGMLASIGIILILKQIPHTIGWDADYMGDESFGTYGGNNTLTYIMQSWERLHLGATLIALISFIIIMTWDKFLSKKIKALALIPSALIAVTVSVLINEFIFSQNSELLIEPSHLVQLPFTGGFNSFIKELSFPNVSALLNPLVWKIALTVAIVASLETLLSLDAADKIDPLKRLSMKNKELRAQGIGNLISGFLGGLPMTAVIVRTSANVTGGGLHKLSAILHGVWLLATVILIPELLNKIPLSVLAVILLLVGWKLATPKIFSQQYKMGKDQFIPFVITIVAILFTDLLVGIAVGLFVGLLFVLKGNSQSSILVISQDDQILIRFSKDVSFLQKARIRKILRDLPDLSHVVIDGSRSIRIDHDIIELIEDFQESAINRNIVVKLQKSSLALAPMFKEYK